MSFETKFRNLERTIGNFPRVVVAYSDGVDSTLLLKVWVDVLGRENVLALISISSIKALGNLDSNGKTA